MNILTLQNISKSYTGRLLFEDASFYLEEGEKVGIIGINGTGKSTLLKIIEGSEEPDEGKVIRANNLTVQLLVQHPTYEEGATVLSAVMESHVKKMREREEIIQKEQTNDQVDYQLTEDSSIYNQLTEDSIMANQLTDYSAMQAEAKSMLGKLGITNFDQPVNELSGGQRKRIALVSALLHKSDVLLLDEPTNHLDAQMSEWLEETLREYKGTLVMITHDRYFLDSVTDRIVEIDRGSIYSYHENYSGFLKRKAEREDSQKASDRKRKSILRNEIEWMMRGARARTTKQKARIERFEQLKNTKLLAEDADIELSSITSRMGKTTVELDGISKSYEGRNLISDFTYHFRKNDRVGFVGPNGCGKTTLMKMIATAAAESVKLEESACVYPDTGSITIGQTIKIGYYSQELALTKESGVGYMDPNKKVIDFVKDIAEIVPTVDGPVTASRMCERFLFDSEKQYGVIAKLSGGEKRRLHLLRILMEAPNVLILDEPTNDLDIKTLTILEDYLDCFDGIVIVVSHDRYFLDRCVRRIFAFEKNGFLRQYEGGYTDYQLKCIIAEGEKANASLATVLENNSTSESKQKGKPQSEKSHKKKLSYKEQREYEGIEQEIADLEQALEDIEPKITSAARDFVKLNELMKEKESLNEKLAERMDRWVYLEELVQELNQ